MKWIFQRTYQYHLKYTFYFPLFVGCVCGMIACKEDFNPEAVLLQEIVSSNIVGQAYQIDIYIPVVDDSSSSLPTVYLLDGDIYFDRMAREVEELIESDQIPPMILIGVGYENTSDEVRLRDLAFPFDPEFDPGDNGQGDLFIRFLEEELIPVVEGRYATDPAHRIMMGHSLGGLMTYLNLFRYPESPFSGFVALSASLWWADGNTFSQELQLSENLSDLPVSLFVGFGTDEEPDIAITNEEMVDRLRNRAYPNFSLKWNRYKGASHGQVPTQGFIDGLLFTLTP